MVSFCFKNSPMIGLDFHADMVTFFHCFFSIFSSIAIWVVFPDPSGPSNIYRRPGRAWQLDILGRI
jgi:hypothetical protein